MSLLLFGLQICDFGLAKLRDLTTVMTANVGTVQWMAPEVLIGNALDESVDIFSMALVSIYIVFHQNMLLL